MEPTRPQPLGPPTSSSTSGSTPVQAPQSFCEICRQQNIPPPYSRLKICVGCVRISVAEVRAVMLKPVQWMAMVNKHIKYTCLIKHAKQCSNNVCLTGGCYAMRMQLAHMKTCFLFKPCRVCLEYNSKISFHVQHCTSPCCGIPRCNWLKFYHNLIMQQYPLV